MSVGSPISFAMQSLTVQHGLSRRRTHGHLRRGMHWQNTRGLTRCFTACFQNTAGGRPFHLIDPRPAAVQWEMKLFHTAHSAKEYAMNIRTLQMFVEVARQGGFSRAGRTMHATQPTVSKAVQSVEEEFGMRLFERLAHGVRLTQEGDMVYRHALRILMEFEALEAEVAALHGLEKGVLRLGLPPVGSGVLFADHFAAYRQRYNAITIHLLEEGCAALEERVLSGELEMALTLLPVSGSFECFPLCDEPLMVTMPPGHPLAGRESLRLDELANEPFIWFERGFILNDRIAALCQKRGFMLQEAFRSGQVDFIITLVAAGMGVAVLPQLELEGRSLPSLHTILLDEDDLRWRAALIWRKNSTLSPAAQAWLNLIKANPPLGNRPTAFPQK